MPQEQPPTKPVPENIDPALLRRFEAYVRSERRGPRISGLHTSDLVSATVLKLLVWADTSRKTLEYQDLRKLLHKIAHDVVVDAIRAISRVARRSRPLDLELQPEATPADQIGIEPEQRDAILRAVQTRDQADYQLVFMRLNGTSWERIASSLGITDDAARKRWQRLLAELRLKLPD